MGVTCLPEIHYSSLFSTAAKWSFYSICKSDQVLFSSRSELKAKSPDSLHLPLSLWRYLLPLYPLIIPATLASSLFHKCDKHPPTPGPLHVLFTLLECPSPRYRHDLFSPVFQVFFFFLSVILPWGLSWSRYFKSFPFPIPVLSIPYSCCIFLHRTYHHWTVHVFSCLFLCLSISLNKNLSFMKVGTFVCSCYYCVTGT